MFKLITASIQLLEKIKAVKPVIVQNKQSTHFTQLEFTIDMSHRLIQSIHAEEHQNQMRLVSLR